MKKLTIILGVTAATLLVIASLFENPHKEKKKKNKKTELLDDLFI